MPKHKTIVDVRSTRETIEGAGVRLLRGFSQPEVPRYDPFLLFDDFSGEDPADYRLGFPWHPHRGIETVTYLLNGEVLHHDSLGHSGRIGKGDVQWMTAGSGILHEEMPKAIPGLQGFQLWVNLPQKDKMTKPRYQDVLAKDIPEISHGNGVVVKVIAGSVHDVSGPVQELMAMPFYLDVRVDAGKEFALPIPPEYNTCLYVIEGAVGASKLDQIGYTKNQILLFSREGDTVYLNAGVSGARFLLMSGKPLGEPVAWYGPIVMNTQEELEQAAYELRVRSFIKEEAQASL